MVTTAAAVGWKGKYISCCWLQVKKGIVLGHFNPRPDSFREVLVANWWTCCGDGSPIFLVSLRSMHRWCLLVVCTLLALSRIHDRSLISPLPCHHIMLALSLAINKIYLCARLEQGVMRVFNRAPISWSWWLKYIINCCYSQVASPPVFPPTRISLYFFPSSSTSDDPHSDSLKANERLVACIMRMFMHLSPFVFSTVHPFLQSSTYMGLIFRSSTGKPVPSIESLINEGVSGNRQLCDQNSQLFISTGVIQTQDSRR